LFLFFFQLDKWVLLRLIRLIIYKEGEHTQKKTKTKMMKTNKYVLPETNYYLIA
jgi:hypothetical protein